MTLDYELKFKKNRPTTIATGKKPVVATYTLDQSYWPTYELDTEIPDSEKIAMAGYVVAMNPANSKVVPNYTSYGFGQVGVLLNDVSMGPPGRYHDREASVIWRGDIIEDNCWDNGGFGSVTQATKDALANRIKFVDETEDIQFGVQL